MRRKRQFSQAMSSWDEVYMRRGKKNMEEGRGGMQCNEMK